MHVEIMTYLHSLYVFFRESYPDLENILIKDQNKENYTCDRLTDCLSEGQRAS